MKSIAAAASLWLGALCLAGCGAVEPAPDASWPEGALLSARTAMLRNVLEDLGRQTTTPLGRTARAWLAVLPDCLEVEAHVPSGEPGALPSSLRCVEQEPSLPGLHAWRGDADLALALPNGYAPRVRLRGTARGDDLDLAIAWPGAPTGGLLGSLLPGDDAAGPSVLTRDAPVIHARVRGPGPLDLGALTPEGSQGDQLFRLRSELFGAAVLDGTWEVAIHPPAEGQAMPQVAVALGVTLESLGRRALDGFIGELEQAWGLSRTPVEFAGAEGVCLLELAVLPDFAPCAVATRDAVVVGWNRVSLSAALAPSEDQPAVGSGRLTIDLDRLRATDEALALGNAAGESIAVVDWPWRRLEVTGRRATDQLDLTIKLAGAGASGS